MNISDEAPHLNPWPFIVADALLLGAAALIGFHARGVLSGPQLLLVGLFIFLGAILAVLPFLLNFTRRQEQALARRQQEVAALAQSTAASVEQLSIAAASLHTIAETAAKSAKQAEQLPQKLQEKIHEFKEQLNEVSMSENEALSQEVNTLRAAETERIETILTTVRKLSSEIARLEAASRKNVTDLAESLTRFTTSAGQAAAEATTAIASLRAGSEASLATAHASAMQAIEETLRHALTEIDTKLSTLSGHLTAKIDHAAEVLDQKINALKSASSQIESSSKTSARRAQRPAAPALTGPAPEGGARSADAGIDATDAAPERANDLPEAATEDDDSDAINPPRSSRRRAVPPAESDHELALGLDLSPSVIEGEVPAPPVMVADGKTRLLVTAYIGIGNYLFLRGEGPGLDWEKGVLLDFVSFGKWQWETTEATTTIRGKLYKNDEVECTSPGEIVLEVGQPTEIAATF